jgi:hypothetical protein
MIVWASSQTRNSTVSLRRIWSPITRKISAGSREKQNQKESSADFAQQTIPTLQKHLQTAQSLAASKQ